jgi:zinc/manganese transport system ATP-binding protein
MPDHLAIRARGVRFAYDRIAVLRDVDLDVPWGAVTALAGANGAGKSTLVEVLAGVRRPSAGTVSRAGRAALVVQRPQVPDTLPLTVADVVSMGAWRGIRGRARRAAAVAAALDRVGLAGAERHRFSALSGGQRQRALLAQGLAGAATVLLLDEPAAGLDAESRERTRTILREEAAAGAAVVCVTHDEAAIAAADRVVQLDGGMIVGDPGPASAVGGAARLPRADQGALARTTTSQSKVLFQP